MSKIKDKFTKKATEQKPRGKITAANIDEHREKTLETGKKFKYPSHIPLHRILLVAGIVFVVAMVIFSIVSWWRLYRAHDTSDFYYTTTRLLPLPVAEVDGQKVNYGDYLRRVRASIYYLENQEGRDFTNEDGQRELNYQRRESMNEAEKVAFAYKIASEKNLAVDSQEVEAQITKSLITESGETISSKAYENSLERYFNWSLDDYRHIVRDTLILREAAFALDESAKNKIDEVKRLLDVGEDFAKVAQEMSDEDSSDAVSMNVKNADPDGLVDAAKNLEVGHSSQIIKGRDAYYIVKLVEKSDSTVKYLPIKVRLTEFDKQFEQLKNDNKIVEYIEINEEK